MASKNKSRAKLTKALKGARTEHKRLAQKVETTRAKLEKRTLKLTSLESKIAEWERRAYLPETEQSGQLREDDKNLRPALLIYNPDSGDKPKDGNEVAKMVATLRAHGIRARLGIATSGKAARTAAKDAANNNEALVIAAGGDGTIENVASQLVDSKTVLGILPMGTMNNLARSLGIPLDLDDACALLGAGTTRQIDVGHVIAHENAKVDYFLETAGLGLTALAFPVSEAAKKHQLSALPHVLRKLFDYNPGPVQIELDDAEPFQVNSQLVTVSNAPLTGLNFLIAPEAKMDDGLLDIGVYEGMSKMELVDYFRAMRKGKHADNSRVKFYRAHQVRVQSLQPAPVISDDDPVTDQRVLEIEVIRQGLTMVVGKGLGLNLPVEAVQSVPPLSGPQAAPTNGKVPAMSELEPESASNGKS